MIGFAPRVQLEVVAVAPYNDRPMYSLWVTYDEIPFVGVDSSLCFHYFWCTYWSCIFNFRGLVFQQLAVFLIDLLFFYCYFKKVMLIE